MSERKLPKTDFPNIRIDKERHQPLIDSKFGENVVNDH